MTTPFAVIRRFLLALAAVACTAPAHAAFVTVVKAGDGSGSVTSNIPGIDCGNICIANFTTLFSVTLQATPQPGSTFVGWTGGCVGSSASCTINLSNQSAVTTTATFALIPTLQSALDNTALSWTTSGNALWAPQSQVFVQGGSAARSGTIAESQLSRLFTTVAGPARLSFSWKVSSEADFDFLTLFVNDVAQGRISGEVDWTSRVVDLPAGNNTLEWRYDKDFSFSAGQDAAWLDNVVLSYPLSVGQSGAGSGLVTSSPAGINCGNTCSATFSNGTQVTLTAAASPGSVFNGWLGGVCSGSGRSPTCTVSVTASATTIASFLLLPGPALDNTTLVWTTSGNALWAPQSQVFFTGGSAARSGAIERNQVSTLSTTVTGPGILSFWWKVSSEQDADFLDFRINSMVQPGPISGEVDWSYRVFNLPAGTHVLEWRFRNDSSVTAGQNAAWLDAVSFSRNPRDFNANGSSDLLWQNTSTGDRYAWFMNGASFASDAFIANVPVAWRIAGTGDFNADGKPDIVWENTVNGDRYLWFMNGSTFVSDAALFNVAADWRIAAVADFNNDGKPDIAWENRLSGLRYVWFMNGTTFSSDAYVGFASTDWSIVGAGDFNADGRTDTVLQNTSTGQLWVWFLNAGVYVSGTGLGTLPAGWSVAGVGDYNADAKPDLVLQNLTTGGRYIWFMNGTTFAGDANLGALPAAWSIAP